MKEITNFWDWFIKNNEQLIRAKDNSKELDKIMDILLTKLHKYCPNLYFKVHLESIEKSELIITAEGNINYFREVEEFVALAPSLKNWEIIAFKPKKGFSFKIDYEGVKLKCEEIYFTPLENEEEPSFIGIRFFLKKYNPKFENIYYAALGVIIETGLGEKCATLEINYWDIKKRPKNFKEEEFIHINELDSYINWSKSQNPGAQTDY